MDQRLRNLPAIRCFLAAAKRQSYSRAAQDLAVTQAAVSQQIRGLEDSLGTKLFRREGRDMLLTNAGRVLAEHADDAFNRLSSGLDKINTEPREGNLTVTTTHSFASMWLMPRMWKFSVDNPGITLSVVASHTFETLRHSDIDVAIRQGICEEPGVFRELLSEDPVTAVCSPKLYNEDLVEPVDVTKCWLVESIDPGPFTWKNWFEVAGIEADSKKLKWLEVATWEMAINAVMAGHGICLSSEQVASEMIRRGQLVKPFDIHIEPGVAYYLMFDEDSPKKVRIDAFQKWLKKEISEQQTI